MTVTIEILPNQEGALANSKIFAVYDGETKITETTKDDAFAVVQQRTQEVPYAQQAIADAEQNLVNVEADKVLYETIFALIDAAVTVPEEAPPEE